MSAQTALWLTLAIPLAGAVIIVLLDRRPNWREAAILLSAGTLFALVLRLWLAFEGGERPGLVLVETLPGLPLALAVEPLGLMFALVASFLWIVTSIYSIGYMRANSEAHQTRFYAAFAIALASTMGVAFAANMFTLFLCYEVLTLSTYPLVTHHGTEEARRAGRVYLGLLLGTSIGFQLLAIVWTWMLAGTLEFRSGGILYLAAPPAVLGTLYALYVFGIGKAALMPFHRWLPAAMVAPVPVSALLHAVAVVKAGVFTIVKVVVYVFGLEVLNDLGAGSQWLLYVSGATILIASIIALRSDNLKRRLAYSTVSQLSYVVMAAALLAPLSVIGAALHIAAHAAGKITLFFAAGSIYTAAHKTEVSELNGIGRRMPWTMGAFAIGSLSMIGVPPAAGFVSKWYILLGAIEAQQSFVTAVIALSTLLNAAYFVPIVYAAFFRPEDRPPKRTHGEAPLPIVIALMLSAALTLLLFVFPDRGLDLARVLAGVAQ